MTTSAAQDAAATTTSRTLRQPGGRLVSWMECGDPHGSPIFWCHGSPGSRLDASPSGPFAADLTEAGLRLIGVDRPGYGHSDQARDHLGAAVADMMAVADELTIVKTAVMGWSGGSTSALALADADPALVQSVVLLAGVAPPDLADITALADAPLLELARTDPAALGRWCAELAGQMALDPMTAIAEILGPTLSEADLVLAADPAFSAVMGASLAEAAAGGLHGFAADLRLLAHPWPVLIDQIRQPVLIVHGDADRVVPLSHGQALAAACPDATLRTTADGHLTVVSHAVELGKAVTA
jgi:pimeloyl-ACP methyl ester carboxylesterase